MKTRPARLLLAMLAFAVAPSALGQACSTPAGAGANPDVLFAHDFDEPAAGGGDPSPGTGGPTAAGNYDDTFTVGSVMKPLYWRVPPGYVPGTPTAVLVVLHGQSQPGQQSVAAKAGRDRWDDIADARGLFLLAPVGSGASGGWNDYDMARVDAAVAELESRYSIDRDRRYLWGFSAGAHFAHLAALYSPQIYAAYAVSAGTLDYAAYYVTPSTAERKTPVSITIGLTDSMLPSVRRDRGFFNDAGWTEPATLRYVEFNGGHTAPLAEMAPTLDFLCGFTLPTN